MFVLFDKAFYAASSTILVFFSSSFFFVKGQSVKRSEKQRGDGGPTQVYGHSDVATCIHLGNIGKNRDDDLIL